MSGASAEASSYESGRTLLISLQQRPEVIVVDGNIRRPRAIVDQHQPLDNAAFDGMSKVMHRVCPVAQAEIDNCRRLRIYAGATPEQVRRMEIVVCPQGREVRQVRGQL